jgi:biotin transport system substrate-specific component
VATRIIAVPGNRRRRTTAGLSAREVKSAIAEGRLVIGEPSLVRSRYMQALHPHTSPTLLQTLAARATADRAAQPIQVASVAFIAALTAAAAQFSIHLPFTQVPITFQPIVVLLGGLVLGARLGAYSQCLYLAAGIIGLPVFAASATLPPGVFRLLGPTGGYLMAYPLAAFVVGVCAERGFDRRWITSIVAMLAGLAVIYTGGVLWLAFFARLGSAPAATGLSAAFAAGVAPFALADALKIAVAAGVVPGLWRLFRLR